MRTTPVPPLNGKSSNFGGMSAGADIGDMFRKRLAGMPNRTHGLDGWRICDSTAEAWRRLAGESTLAKSKRKVS